MSRIHICFVAMVAMLLLDTSAIRADEPIAKTNETEANSDFRMPTRRTTDRPSEHTTFDLQSVLGKSGPKIGICIGILVLGVLLFSKQKSTRGIPREAVEVLGIVPMGHRQQVQLIRFGQKLVLVEASSNGLKPLSEITEPSEVHRMLDLIRPRS